MKSIHSHRIIKDKVVQPPGIDFPVSNSLHSNNLNAVAPMKKLIPLSAHAQFGFPPRQEDSSSARNSPFLSVGFPSIERGNSSSSSNSSNSSDRGESVSNLQKRLKDLEKENYRLSHHISQAEQTLRNYRDVFGSLPVDLPSNTSKHNNSNNATEVKPIISSAKSAPPAIPLINKENIPSNAELATKIEELSKKLQDSQVRISSLLLEKEKDSLTIQDLKTHLVTQQEYNKQQLQKTKEKHELEKQSFLSQVTSLREEITQYKIKLTTAIAPSSSSSTSSSHLQQLVLALSNSSQSLKEENQRLKTSSVETILSFQNYSSQKIKELQDCFSVIHNNTLNVLKQQKSEYIVYKVECERRIHDLEDKLLSTSQQIIKKSSSKTIISPIKLKAMSPTKITNQSMEESIGEKEEMSKVTREYQNKIEITISSLQSLQDLHFAEIKSIKHLAHIRELIRVAKERESAIDKDRMIIEIKHLK
jgi:hypothetical protein